MKRLTAVVLGVVMLVIAVPSAAASSGSFTRSTVNPEWTTASFAVSGTSTACTNLGKCSWLPIVIAQPALPQYGCGFADEPFFDSDPNTREIWAGQSAAANGPFSGSATNQPILSGVHGQELCLAIIGSHFVKDVVCEAQAKVLEEFGSGPISCPPVERTFEENLAYVLPTVEVPPKVESTPTPTPPATAKPKRVRCPKSKKRVVRKGKVKCVPKRKHKPKRR